METETAVKLEAHEHEIGSLKHRVRELEAEFKAINELTMSVNRLAVNMENMLQEQKAQAERLETLESRDGDMWRKVVGHIVTTVIGIVLGYLFMKVGM